MAEAKILTEEEIISKVEFLSSHRCNHTPHKYIDITGDLIAGTLLSQIMYWFADGKNRVSIHKDGHYWIAKRREDWMSEIRITQKQYDCAIKKLTGEIEPTEEEKKKKWNKGKRREKKYDMDNRLVEVKTYHFYGVPTTHIRPITENINRKIDEWKKSLEEEIRSKNNNACSPNLPKGNLVNSQNSNLEINETENSYNIYNNINISTESTNIDYSTDTTDNSLSNDKDNSKDKSFELHNSHVSEEHGSRISMQIGVKRKDKKETPLKDMPTRAREMAYCLVYDEELSQGVYDCIEYFLERHKQKNRREHLPLRNDTLQNVVEVMLSSITILHDEDIENVYESIFYPLVCHESDFDDRVEVIDKYFETQFNYCDDVDYSLVHFTHENVITHVMQKCYRGNDANWYESEPVN